MSWRYANENTVLKMANCSCRYCSWRYICKLAITEIALFFSWLFLKSFNEMFFFFFMFHWNERCHWTHYHVFLLFFTFTVPLMLSFWFPPTISSRVQHLDNIFIKVPSPFLSSHFSHGKIMLYDIYIFFFFKSSRLFHQTQVLLICCKLVVCR